MHTVRWKGKDSELSTVLTLTGVTCLEGCHGMSPTKQDVLVALLSLPTQVLQKAEPTNFSQSRGL